MIKKVFRSLIRLSLLSKNMSRRKLLIDTDAGIDDAQAILMALAYPDVEVVAITTVHGNTDNDQVARNVLRLLKVAGRLEIPVYMGCNTSLMGHTIKATNYHGLDGFGDVPDPEAPGLEMVQAEHASNAIIRIINENPGEISLIGLAPLTNIALALRLDPTLGSKLKDCYIMGGNFEGKGNITEFAEFNFYSDPESADVTLRELKCPITIVCWELCLRHSFPWDWKDQFNAINTNTGKLMTAIEAKTIETFYTNGTIKNDSYQCADQFAMAAVLSPRAVISKKSAQADVDTSVSEWRGHMNVDWDAAVKNVDIILEMDEERYYKLRGCGTEKSKFLKEIESLTVKNCQELNWESYIPCDEIAMSVAINSSVISDFTLHSGHVEVTGEKRGMLILESGDMRVVKKVDENIYWTMLEKSSF